MDQRTSLVLLLVASLALVRTAAAAEASSTIDSVTPPGYKSPLKKYTDFFEGGATEHEAELMDWLIKHGFQDSGIVRQIDDGVRGRGMRYIRPTEKGDELFAVPVELMVYTSNPHIHETTKKALELFRERFRKPGYVRDDFELTEMALIVMFERRNPESFFKPYLQMLQFPLCPAFYSLEKMSTFEYSWLTDWRLYFMSDCVKNFELLLETPEFKLLKSENIKSEFMWAVSTVLQRSFDWGPDARREYVMVPYLDMINHEQNIANNYYYSNGPLKVRKPTGNIVPQPITRSMVIGADSKKVKGDPVTISYSMASSNIQMLLQYGFVVADNPNDYLVLQLKAPEGRPDYHQVIKELGGVLGSVSASSEYGVPLDFVRAVSLVETGAAELTVGAYETIKKAVEEDLKSFSSTLEEDQALLSSGKLDRLDFSAVAYRVEAKKLLTNTIKRIDSDIKLIKEGKEPGPADKKVRRDWPMRHVIVQPTTAHDPPPADSAAEGQEKAADKKAQGDDKKEL